MSNADEPADLDGGTARKMLARENVARWASVCKEAGLRVVFTNGVFDLLHVGHVRYLQQARQLGDTLVVALNSDESTRWLKGPDRPFVPQDERAEILAALACVDAVTIFEEHTAEALVAVMRPDIYVKGGDYAQGGAHGIPQMIGPDELRALSKDATLGESASDEFFRRLPEARVVSFYGGTVCLIPYVAGHSTTELIARIVSHSRHGHQ